LNYLHPVDHRDQMLNQLHRAIAQHTIELNEAFPDLIMELRKFKSDGSTKDDLVMALAMAIYIPTVKLRGQRLGGAIYINGKLLGGK